MTQLLLQFRSHLIVFILLFGIQHFLWAQSADFNTGCAPLNVQFTAPGGFPAYYWDFKDGTTSSLQNPVNTFTNPGTYLVELFQGPGGPLIGSLSITVFPKPDLNINATPVEGCKPLPVQFQDNSSIAGGIVVNSYNWVFGDGAVSNGPSNPMHTYNMAGNFTVTLMIETNYLSCNTTEVFSNLIQASNPPTSVFSTTPNPAVTCNPPLIVSFNNTSTGSGPLTWDWDFGNGQTSLVKDPPAQTYSNNGQFTVTLTVTDTNNCSATSSRLVSIGKPTASFSMSDTVCVNNLNIFQNTSPAGTYNWTFGPGAVPSSSTLINPAVQFTQPGNYSVHLVVTTPDGQCMDDTVRVIYADLPDPSFVSDPGYACQDPVSIHYQSLSNIATQWIWYFSDGSVSNEQAPTHVFVNGDTTLYSMNGLIMDTTYLTVVNPSGCLLTTFQIDTIWEPNALFMPDTAMGCFPLAVTFYDSSHSNEPIELWDWDYGDGQFESFTNNMPHDHIYTQPGEYWVRLAITNAAGCVDTSYAVLIQVGGALAPDFSLAPAEVCLGDTVHFTDLSNLPEIDAWHYSTENDRSWHCYGDPNPFWVFTSEYGYQDVTLTVEYNGCYSEVTKDSAILVKGPIAQLNYMIQCSNPNAVMFSDSSRNASSILWDFGDGTTSTQHNVNHPYGQTGNYWVKLTAMNPGSGCQASVDSALIHIRHIQAAFSLQNDKICLGVDQVLDASASVDANSSCWKGYTWHFSNTDEPPLSSPDSIVYYAFPDTGIQSLSLVVEDINGCKDTATQYVTVYGVYGNLTVDDDFICPGQVVHFTDLSTADTTLATWQWTFGDLTQSNQQNPTHIYQTTADSFIVILTVFDVIGCSNGKDTIIIHDYQPISTITTDPFNTNLCVGQSVIFNASDYTAGGSHLTFQWDFDNGQSSNLQTAQATYNDPGLFNASLIFQEIASGCRDTVYRNVSVQDYPVANFATNVDGLPILCYPIQIFFDDQSQSNYLLTYNWNFGNGQTSNLSNPAVGLDKGTFLTTLIITTPNGCSDTTSRSFTTVGPEGDFTLDQNQICKGETITFTIQDTSDVSNFTWSFGDGTQSMNTSPVSHTYQFNPPSGQTIVKLVLQGENPACTFTVEKPVFIYQVIADFERNDGIDTSVCFGLAYPFTNTSEDADIYSWNFGDGATATVKNPTHQYSAPGVYTVTLAVQNALLGCKDTIQYQVVVDEIPNLAAYGDTVCLGDTALIGVINPMPGWSFDWSPDNLLIHPDSASTQAVVSSDTPFAVLVTDANGCKGTADAPVNVILPFNSFNLDTVIVAGEPVVLPVQYDPVYLYSWNPESGLSCVNCNDPVVMPEVSIVYELAVMDILGCFDTAFTYRIRIYPDSITVPSAFTPNNDNLNDFFNIFIPDGETDTDVQILRFDVYNRWGQKVYENGDKAKGWDGKFNNKEQPSDVYLFTLEVQFKSGKKKTVSGDVTLIR